MKGLALAMLAGALLAAACSGTTAPGVSDASSPTPSAAKSPRSIVPRTFTIELPPGWVGADATDAGLATIAEHLRPAWNERAPNLAESVVDDTTSYVAFGPPELGVPLSLTVSEEQGEVDLECHARNEAYEAEALGLLDLERTSVALPVGPGVRLTASIKRKTGDAFAEFTFVVAGGRTYTVGFLTRSDRRSVDQPVLASILQTFQVTTPAVVAASPGPAGGVAQSIVTLSHADPVLEARLPERVLGLPLCSTSMAGPDLWDLLDRDRQEALVADLGLPLKALTFAWADGPVVGRDPPFGVGAIRYAGAVESELLAHFSDGLVRNVSSKTLYFADHPDEPGITEGLDYAYTVGDTVFLIVTNDDEWLMDVLRQLP